MGPVYGVRRGACGRGDLLVGVKCGVGGCVVVKMVCGERALCRGVVEQARRSHRGAAVVMVACLMMA